MRRRRLVFFSLLLAIGFAGSARAVSIIDTTSSWDGTLGVGGFGEKADTAATYGQTFRAPASDTVLDSFTFFVDDRFAGPVHFEGFVMAWDGVKASGPVLYQSAPMGTTDNLHGYEEITLLTGGVELTANAEYVAFLSASNVFDQQDDSSRWAFLDANAYGDGAFVWALNGNDFSLLSSHAWSRYGGYSFSDDLAFRMSFSSPPVHTPEPHAALLFGVGAFVVARAIRRAERARAVA